MKSGLRCARRTQPSGPPVPMGGDASGLLPGMAPGANTDLTLIRAYNSNGTVRSNVGLIASSVAAQDWRLYRQAADGSGSRYTTSDQGSDSRPQVTQHAALNVLLNPACINVDGVRWPVWDRVGLFKVSQIWMEQCGKSYWVVDNAEGASRIPLGLWPVRPDRMMPVPDARNYLAGWIYTAPDGRERIPLLPTEVIWNRDPDPEDLYGGSGPVRSVLTDVQAAGYAAEWNRNWFVNSAEPGGVIQVPGNWDDEELNEFIDRWRDTHRGVARAHRIAVLEGGATWVQNAHSIRDMDFVNLRNTSRDIIREALGVGKTMTGVSDDVNRANAQTSQEVFAAWTVDPRLRQWRGVLNSQFLPLFRATAAGNEFDYIYPMPENREQNALELTTKANAALALVTAGYDPADVLEAVGLPEMGVAERATQQPAAPPGWVPAGVPAGGDGASGGIPAEALLEAAGWTSPAWGPVAALDSDLRRRVAAWNAAGSTP